MKLATYFGGRLRRPLMGAAAIAVLTFAPFAAAPASAAALNDISWSAGPPMPSPHVEGALAPSEGAIWSISGGTGDCTDGLGSPPNAAVDIYNPKTGTFSVGPSVNHPRDLGPLAANVAGTIYLIGGFTSCPLSDAQATTVRTVEVASSAGGWSDLPLTADLPATFSGADHCGVAVGKDIYYFTSAGIGVFDTSTETWNVLPANPLLTPSLFCQATRVGPNDPAKARVYITGPGNGKADAESMRILVFHPFTGAINLVKATTVPLAEHSSARLKGHVVVVGGDFSPTAVQAIKGKTVTTLSSLPAPRDDGLGIVMHGKYYILGGTSGGVTTPPVLIGEPI
jgi:hypothetical protein